MVEMSTRMELLDNELESLKVTGFSSMVSGTRWILPRGFLGLVLTKDDGEKEDKLRNYVCDELGLYPHGSIHIEPQVSLRCDDSSIELIYESTLEESRLDVENRRKNHTGYYTVYSNLFRLSKKYGFEIDLIERVRDIEYHQKEVKSLERELEFLKSLKG
jgi:hypothetical protein